MGDKAQRILPFCFLLYLLHLFLFLHLKECQVARRTVPRPRDGRQFRAIQVCPHFIQCDGDPHRPSRFECQVEPSFQSDVAEWHRSISAKYGLWGIRVGEASHPGPVSRATSRRTQIDSDSDAPLVNSGRFMALSRDRDGSDEDVGAEPPSRQSGKRLRVTRRDRARASQETHSREIRRV